LHAQHQGTQMLDCVIAIHEQDSGFASGHSSHDLVRILRAVPSLHPRERLLVIRFP
jgi:hypothetical protein